METIFLLLDKKVEKYAKSRLPITQRIAQTDSESQEILR
jgi:hypothetical protein